jgi:hypothetical protein
VARRIPNGAYCGEPLKDTDCFQRIFPAVAGKPEIGWHTSGPDSCMEQDPLCSRIPAANPIDLVRQLQTIEGRGSGRVVANKQWRRA